jgi:tetratricopeptide (TPR) repeat protein
MGKYQEALDDYNMAIQVDGGKGPRAYEVYLKMGDVLKTAGDFSQALQAYDAAVQIAKKQDTSKQVCVCACACI